MKRIFFSILFILSLSLIISQELPIGLTAQELSEMQKGNEYINLTQLPKHFAQTQEVLAIGEITPVEGEENEEGRRRPSHRRGREREE